MPGHASILYDVTQIVGFDPARDDSALNDSGQVAGTTSTGMAGTWSNGVVVSVAIPGASSSEALGINNSGDIAGEFCPSGGGVCPAFLYSNSLLTNLGTLGGIDAVATGINEYGQAAGYLLTSAGPSHAFLYENGNMTDIGTLGGSSSIAYGINNSGEVTGNSAIASGDGHAFLYSAGTMTDLGTLGGTFSSGVAINNSGQTVGVSYMPGNGAWHAFLDNGGKMTDLGTLGGTVSEADGVNDSGQVVGFAFTAGGVSHAFLYSAGTMIDLNSVIDPSLNITLQQAYAINNADQILAIGNHGWELLTPVAAAPEPSAWLLFSGGFLGFAMFRRRNRFANDNPKPIKRRYPEVAYRLTGKSSTNRMRWD
ncbi:MAG TPA: PEP-CTERM sorting domain-containing protein [Bryobacteraceae bacterium]|nr:PEP-CTERM sorting domain-containing protein [Bryobacteraceae bacterium]